MKIFQEFAKERNPEQKTKAKYIVAALPSVGGASHNAAAGI